ncbi:TadA family conjugal transfer-associated ATPase [Actinomyces urogenitalis]|uniref:TadA family conjugal transfer-associated ATPase n=1 Tax=Actinomyces urogenitalis TaxID=103621 RepID=UPI0024314AC3|nr:TadA family conjugal transfer-associated ATPase [Actinomyces urogenitalis]MCI7456092.1 TadA family conjugal transfer-associated ATPase [Actinomyces urogenitalis]
MRAAEELERVRGALARGASLSTALEEESDAATGMEGLARLHERVHCEVEGAGSWLQPLLETDGVTDVLVGAGCSWIDRGRGLEEVHHDLPEDQVRALAVRMAASAGRRLDEASPVVDATLADGTRLNAVLPPLSADGTLICLRTSRPQAFSLAELIAAGTLTPSLAEVLAALVAGRASCLVTGATGTGKTTLLAALLSLVEPTERIVCIEEASELRPNHPHVIHLQERQANVQGVGEVTMTSLVRTALRMRPDRIVLGECRGPEVREVLTALNTGHEGGWATLHANAPVDVPARLTALGALAGMDEATVAAQAASALDVVIHLQRLARRRSRPGGGAPASRRARREEGPSVQRVVTSLGVLLREEDSGRLVCREALHLRDGALLPGPGHAQLVALLRRAEETGLP